MNTCPATGPLWRTMSARTCWAWAGCARRRALSSEPVAMLVLIVASVGSGMPAALPNASPVPVRKSLRGLLGRHAPGSGASLHGVGPLRCLDILPLADDSKGGVPVEAEGAHEIRNGAVHVAAPG